MRFLVLLCLAFPIFATAARPSTATQSQNKRKKGEARELERQALMRKREEQAQMIKVLKASDAENKESKKGK